ncbi:hypothetical protein ACF0H5_015884 [Mactra antiquata]
MSKLMKFSSMCGENIKLCNSLTTAEWNLKTSSGRLYIKDPLSPGQTVKLLFQGSGHCNVGYTTNDPNISSSTTTAACMGAIELKRLQFHKQYSILEMTLNKNKKEISASFRLGDQETKEERFKLSPKKPVWVSLDIRHGIMEVKAQTLDSPEKRVQFSCNHGKNVKLEEHSTIAKSLTVSPATTCFLDKPLNIGDILQFQCSPIQDQGRPAHIRSLKVQIFEKNPKCLAKECKCLFDASEGQIRSPVTMIQELDRKESNGTINLCLVSPTLLECRTATNKNSSHDIKRISSDCLWVVLELFRVAVTITQYKPKTTEDKHANATESAIKQCKPPDCNGMDVVDGVIPTPVNELAENTASFSINDDTSLKRVVNYSEYSRCESMNQRTNQPRRSTSQMLGTTDLGQGRTGLEGRFAELERGHKELHEQVDRLNNMLHCRNQIDAKNKMTMNVSIERKINFRSHFTTLVKDIDCMPLLDKLFEQNMISQVDYDGTAQQNTSIDRNRTLLRLLNQKNITKVTMDRILDSVEQGHLKDKF